MPSSRAALADRRVVRGRSLAELGHHAEHGDAAAGRQRGQRLERRRDRGGVGVVGVVEDERRRSAPCRSSIRHARQRRRAPGPAPPRPRRCPRPRPAAAAASAFSTWCRPRTLSVTLASLPRRCEHERRPQLVVEREVLGADVAAVAEGDRRWPRCATPWRPPARRPAFEDRDPAGAAAPRPARPWRAPRRRSCRTPRCARRATRVTMPDGRGRDARTAPRCGRCPGRPSPPRPPAVPSGALSSVSGHAQLVVERLRAGGGDEPLAEDAGEEVLHRRLADRAGDPEHRARQPRPREPTGRLQRAPWCRRRRSPCRPSRRPGGEVRGRARSRARQR